MTVHISHKEIQFAQLIALTWRRNKGFECKNTCKDMEPQTFQLTILIYTALQLSNTVTLDNYMVTFPTTVNCSTKTGLCKETQVGSLKLAQSSTPRMDNFAICQHSSPTTARVAFTKIRVPTPQTSHLTPWIYADLQLSNTATLDNCMVTFTTSVS